MKKIVVGVDGSDNSKQALRWAIDNAGGAEVVALHAYDVPLPVADATPGHPLDFAEIVTKTHEGAVQFATSIVDEVVGDHPAVKAEAVEGRPVEVLIEAAASADLLVIGSYGAGRAELLLGSVSLECVEQASGPVLIYRQP
jgi:nucleotide-binding universal stress UspA family protein